jgi:uncharacterized protein (TIGR02118 family)
MLKFIVVLYKRPDMTVDQFRDYFRNVHGPMVQSMPGLRKYIQNYVVDDPTRNPPGWHAIAELYFTNWETMEAAWSSPQGEAATNDLEAFADLTRTTWSVVEEAVIIG